MKWALLVAMAASLVAAPLAPASVPAENCAEKCCAEAGGCCADACPCPTNCVIPGSTTAVAPVMAQVPVVQAAPRQMPLPADEWAADLPQTPPVPPPRA